MSIYDGICKKYIIASILYYYHDISPVEDTRFDNWALTLKLKYKDLPPWFKEKVSYEDLSSGTGFHIKVNEKEFKLAESLKENLDVFDNYF